MLSGVASKKIYVRPYSILAEYYDQVMDHVDYSNWALYIFKIVQRHGRNFKNIIDISCGTGSLCLELRKKGFNVMGSDVCVEMVKSARKKNSSISFWCSDMVKVSFKCSPEIVVSLYDSMNYMLESHQWLSTLKQVYGILQNRGLFIFDISTFYNSRVVFKKYQQKEHLDGCIYFRKSYFDEETGIQANDFEFKLSQDPKVIYIEQHKQKIRALEEIEKIIHKTPFQIVAAYSDFTLLPVTQKSKRIHFILKK